MARGGRLGGGILNAVVIHYSVGCVNSIPLPICGSFQANAIRYTRKDLRMVSCARCRRILINCGTDLPDRAEKAQTTNDDVIIYTLPSFAKVMD